MLGSDPTPTNFYASASAQTSITRQSRAHIWLMANQTQTLFKTLPFWWLELNSGPSEHHPTRPTIWPLPWPVKKKRIEASSTVSRGSRWGGKRAKSQISIWLSVQTHVPISLSPFLSLSLHYLHLLSLCSCFSVFYHSLPNPHIVSLSPFLSSLLTSSLILSLSLSLSLGSR